MLIRSQTPKNRKNLKNVVITGRGLPIRFQRALNHYQGIILSRDVIKPIMPILCPYMEIYGNLASDPKISEFVQILLFDTKYITTTLPTNPWPPLKVNFTTIYAIFCIFFPIMPIYGNLSPVPQIFAILLILLFDIKCLTTTLPTSYQLPLKVNFNSDYVSFTMWTHYWS